MSREFMDDQTFFAMELKEKLTRRGHISESLIFGLLLAFVGGFQDAYTYVVRGHAFANVWLGNAVLLGYSLVNGKWQESLFYLAPLLAFVAGSILAEHGVAYLKRRGSKRFFRSFLFCEIIIIFRLVTLPQSQNMLVNVIMALLCAVQMKVFNQFCDCTRASTRCLENLADGTVSLITGLGQKNREKRNLGLCCLGTVAVFVLGAWAGGRVSQVFGEMAIGMLVPVLILEAALLRLDAFE